MNYRLFVHRDLKSAIWGKICQPILPLSGGLLALTANATRMEEMKLSRELRDRLPWSHSMRPVRSVTMAVHQN